VKRFGSTRVFVVYALSVASGVLLALVLPPRGISLLGWAAFLPLLAASRLAGRPLSAAMGGLVCMVRVREGRTLYSRWGDYFAWLSLCALPAVFALSRKQRRK
jgi:apolipoprotein N-acyltransferase